MEDELKAISAELAASIRREMDLEDMVDRLQAEKDNPAATGNKRTSDYFSDSGYSSAKFSEYDQSREEIEKIQRRSEQEKAQLRLELTSKLQDERLRRQNMDEQIRDLSTKASQVDLSAMNGADASDRVKELEATCETLRRKLSEERQVKDNFEDLLSALKGELHNASNERDNLRDEMVPQLQARVEGLESQAAELEKMTYESTKMQQELHNLRNENSNLKQSQMDSITEEGSVASAPTSAPTSAPLSRSNSVGAGSRLSYRPQRPPSVLMRSKTVKASESRDQLSERLKDVEEQRDALHRALKNLLERQELQERESQKKIRFLEMERDRLLTSSPKKAGFTREITNLRSEITVLRRRAEEALDQKWQVEKGLAGLKMDLDKAEQEVSYLRKILEEKDILIPPAFARSSSGSDQLAGPVTSDSLMATYQDLQNAYADSLQRIKSLEAGTKSDEKTQAAMEKLEQALSTAITQRNLAQDEAQFYREQLASLKAGEKAYLESEKALADELQESARRVEELAIQVQQQLSTNRQLRERIAETVSRGDANQKANVEQITSMQARLRILEEKLEAAQAASEDRVARHEEEMAVLKESHSEQLTRLGAGLRSPRTFPAKSPLSPLFTASGARSPRLEVTRAGPAMNVSEETQIDNLKARVAELENALMDADSEMQQVVGRMNTAQIEVLELQEEREAAINQTRKLERELQAEKVIAFEKRFKSFQL
jgi:chromosome segregation ATPase